MACCARCWGSAEWQAPVRFCTTRRPPGGASPDRRPRRRHRLLCLRRRCHRHLRPFRHLQQVRRFPSAPAARRRAAPTVVARPAIPSADPLAARMDKPNVATAPAATAPAMGRSCAAPPGIRSAASMAAARVASAWCKGSSAARMPMCAGIAAAWRANIAARRAAERPRAANVAPIPTAPMRIASMERACRSPRRRR